MLPAMSPLNLSVPPETAAAPASTPFPIKVNGQNGTTPSLPPQMASVRSHTTDELMQMMNKTPLFMTSLDDDGMCSEYPIGRGSVHLMIQARWREYRA